KHIEQDRRKRQDHHRQHGHDQQRHAESVAREVPEDACCAAHAHASSYSSPIFGSGRATRAATVGFSVRIRKMYESTWATAMYRPAGISRFRSVERYSARASLGDSKTGTRFSSAIRRMLSATRSTPFASTRGARILFGSYFSATAKCVGFTMTTSAPGTLCIIRRRANSCCI